MEHDHIGELIVVKDVYGSLLVRRLCGVTKNGVFIQSEEEWIKRSAGLISLDPVGFPARDVYLYPTENKNACVDNGKISNLGEDSLIHFFRGVEMER